VSIAWPREDRNVDTRDGGGFYQPGYGAVGREPGFCAIDWSRLGLMGDDDETHEDL
jgi:hypothetical protein